MDRGFPCKRLAERLLTRTAAGWCGTGASVTSPGRATPSNIPDAHIPDVDIPDVDVGGRRD
jgi:hypothetical protein